MYSFSYLEPVCCSMSSSNCCFLTCIPVSQEAGKWVSESCSVVSDSFQPHVLHSPWNSPGQNTGVSSLSLLQGILPTQGSNPGLLHFRRILYQLSHRKAWKQVKWSGIPISGRIFQFIVIHTVKGFGVVNKAEVDVFLELCCFSYDPTEVGNLISGSSAFSKSILNIWKFSVHILLKPGLENFDRYFASMWDEYNCAVVWTFFGIAFLWDWNKNWRFSVLWPLLSFPNLLAYWVQHFHSIIFQDLK